MKSELQILWMNVCARCNPESAECKRYPKYNGTENKFNSFQEFSVWCESSEGYGLRDAQGRKYALDKDLAILAGVIQSKAYGEHCVFLPEKLNSVVKTIYGYKDQLPGVTPYRGDRYRMQFRQIDGTKKHGGIFDSEIAAHLEWRKQQAVVFTQAADICTQLRLHKASSLFTRASVKFKEQE